jgi:hypothetical protein
MLDRKDVRQHRLGYFENAILRVELRLWGYLEIFRTAQLCDTLLAIAEPKANAWEKDVVNQEYRSENDDHEPDKWAHGIEEAVFALIEEHADIRQKELEEAVHVWSA